MIARRRQSVRRLISLAVLLLAASTLPACGQHDQGQPEPTASTSATPDAAAARKAVLTAYDNWLTAYHKIAAGGYVAATDDTVLKRYLVEPDLSQTISALTQLADLNVVSRGTPKWTDRVTSLDLDADPPTAVLQVCLDLSRYTSVDKTTGENVTASNQLLRYKVAVAAKRVNGTWFISQETSQRNTAC